MNYLTYFLYPAIIVIITILLYFILKKCSKKVQTITISIFLFISLAVHFLKLLIPEYRNDLANTFINSTLNTPCAVTTLLFPFIFLTKNDKAKDFIVVFAFLSGLLTILIPTEIMDHPTFDIETIRFYFAHGTLFMCAILIYLLKLHTLTSNWIKNVLIGITIEIAIIFINDFIIYASMYGFDTNTKLI